MPGRSTHALSSELVWDHSGWTLKQGGNKANVCFQFSGVWIILGCLLEMELAE